MAHHDPSEKIAGRALLGLTGGAFVALSAAIFGSIADALLFWGALAVFVAPGVAPARRFFSGPAAWLAGAEVGYLASSVLASLLVRAELGSPLAVLLAPLGLFALALVVFPRRQARSGESGGLAASFLLVLAVAALPFLAVGSEVPGGTAYRAYFSADLMTHLSVVAELQKTTFPLENPFYSGESLGYYWLVFAFPAAVGEWTSNQGALLSLYLASGALFAGLLFVVARRLGLSPARALLLTAVAIGAVGYDGLLALVSGEPWTAMNVDAFARWAFELTSLDGLHRGILYTPQHLFSYSLLLVLVLLVIDGEPTSLRSASFCGVLLGGMAGASIVTAMLAGPWLVLVLLQRRESLGKFFALATVTTAVSLLFLAWYVALGFFGGAGAAFTLRVPRMAEIPSLLLIDCGALVLLVALRRRLRPSDAPFAILAAMALAAVLFLDLEGYEGVWMAWRAGSVLLVALAVLAAPALAGGLGLRHAVVLLPAFLTLVLDTANARDVSNRELSAGEFRWTTVVSPDELEALRWLREETAKDAVVQWDVRARELGEWAMIPALAERRMAVGFPIFLLDVRKYRVRERRHVRPIFLSEDASEAHRLASELEIDYLFVGATELRTRGERLRALFEAPALFRPVLENESVTVLEVVPP